VSETAYWKIQKRAIEHVASHMADYFDPQSGGRGDTPIEQILFAALAAEIKFGHHEHTCIHSPPRGVRYDFDATRPYIGVDEEPLIVESQVELNGWRVDFLVTSRSEKEHKRLIVECDGHDFHERTKSQAAKDRSRDREFQRAGYTVFRFTGSEIWNAPCRCADQIIDWAVDALCGAH
jgi:very-short-patch-repair endonuclease